MPEIKTFLGTISEASDQANAYLGHDMFNDEFRKGLLDVGKKDELTHLCISLAKLSASQVVVDYTLISSALNTLQLNGMTHKVSSRTEKTVRKKLKQLARD